MYTEHFVKGGCDVRSPFYQPKEIERHNKAIPYPTHDYAMNRESRPSVGGQLSTSRVIYKEILVPIMMIEHSIFARSNTILSDRISSKKD